MAQAALLILLSNGIARAHNGPPFAILTDQRVGPCVISLWAHPDIGTSSFWIMVDPPPGGSIPKDLKIRMGIQPASGRLPEVFYDAWVDSNRGQLEYKTDVEFDRQDFFKVRLVLSSAAGNGEAFSQVEATPYGFGRWDLLFYLLPFLGVGFLFFKAVIRRRRLRRQQAAQVAGGGA
ncbi:MAG TPA: hypothetical protein VMT51_13980 [Dongiaceae bacterium]|nr:hypothetical protein [Dongiaceae bacterium]